MRASAERAVPIVIALAVVATGELAAQVRVEIGPQAGLYLPTTAVATRLSGFTSVAHLRNGKSGAVGGRLTVWLLDRFGFEASLWRVPTSLSGRSGGIVFEPGDVRLLYTTLRGLLRWGDPSGSSVHLAFGGGRVGRDGEGYRAYTDISDFTLVAGVGATAQLAGRLAMRWDLEDYVSWANFEERSIDNPDTFMQHDLALSASLVVHLFSF